MKKDVGFLVIGVAAVAAFCFGLSRAYPPPRLSVMASTPAAAASQPTTTTRVVMRIDGQPVTLAEFQAAYASLPEQMQEQYASEQGKRAVAEQLIRIKLLERKAEQMGVEKDPDVAARIENVRDQILANAVLPKLIQQPNEASLKAEYDKQKSRFETVELRHILVAYEGGEVPPRSGKAPPIQQAQQKAASVILQLRGGTDFGELARQMSDDAASAARGGALGTVGRGMLPPELEWSVFRLQPGQISDPVRSRFGVHVFQVTRRSTQSFDQAKAALAQQNQRKELNDVVETLRRQARVDFDPSFFPAPRPAAPKK